MTDWEPSYLDACEGEPTLTDPEEIRDYWRRWRIERGFEE